MSEKHTVGYKIIFNGDNFNHIEGPLTVTVGGLGQEFLAHILNNPELIEMIGEGYWDLEIKLSPNLEVEKESSGREEEES